jgi:hypothetical protein
VYFGKQRVAIARKDRLQEIVLDAQEMLKVKRQPWRS